MKTKIIKLAAQGLSDEQIAHECGKGADWVQLTTALDPDLATEINRVRAEFIDVDAVESCARVGATAEEISAYLGREPTFLADKMLQNEQLKLAFERGRSAFKMDLRRWQYDKAQNNSQLLIWLGKQFLEQSEKINMKTSSDEKTEQELIERELLAQIGENSALREELERIICGIGGLSQNLNSELV